MLLAPVRYVECNTQEDSRGCARNECGERNWQRTKDEDAPRPECERFFPCDIVHMFQYILVYVKRIVAASCAFFELMSS